MHVPQCAQLGTPRLQSRTRDKRTQSQQAHNSTVTGVHRHRRKDAYTHRHTQLQTAQTVTEPLYELSRKLSLMPYRVRGAACDVSVYIINSTPRVTARQKQPVDKGGFARNRCSEGCADSLGRDCTAAPFGTLRDQSLCHSLQRGHTIDAAVSHQVEMQPRWN